MIIILEDETKPNRDDAPQVADEEEWKSIARRKMLQFEQQLHEGETFYEIMETFSF